MNAPRHDPERGAALIAALLLIATLAVLSLQIAEAVRFDAVRSAHLRERVQATWMARGAESYARIVVDRLRAEGPPVFVPPASWEAPGLSLALDGGVMWLRLRAADRCFNVNSLVRPDGEGWQGDALALRQFEALLESLGMAPGEAATLAASLVDWIDSDTRPGSGGAEDATYMTRDPPHRAGNTLMADISELAVVAGFGLEELRRLRPLLCALPETGLSPINLNALRPADAPLLVALTAGALSLPEAGDVIASRPVGGFTEIEAFWELPGLAEVAPDEAVRAQPVLSSRYLDLLVEVRLGSVTLAMQSLLAAAGGGTFRVVRRSFGWPAGS